jgi:hypothetical protein
MKKIKNKKSEPSKIREITVQTRPPSDSNPQGVAACGAYQVIGNEVSLVDRKTGLPLRDNQGRLYTAQLHRDNDDGQRIAKRLLKEFDAAKNSGKSDFNRVLVYPDAGIV